MSESLSGRNIKVLHIRSTIGMYGAEQVLLNVLPELNKCCKASLLTLETDSPESATLRKLLSPLAVKTYHFVPSGRIDSQVIRSIKNMIKDSEFNIVHTHDYKSLFYVYKTIGNLNIPIVHHIHGALGNTFSEKVYTLIEKYMMRKVSRIVTVSHEQKRSLEQNVFSYPDVKQVNNGTIINFIGKNIRSDAELLTLIMVARFTEEKNHAMAIDLIEKLKEINIPVILTLLGNGPLKADLEEAVINRDLAGSIKFVGFTRDVCSWLDKSDVLLITSTTEGMPLNMLEGMERGLPVISTAVGEIPKLIKDANCGDTYATLDELVHLVDSIYNNKSEWKRLGSLGRAHVKNKLSVENQVEDLYLEYSGLCK